MSSIDLPQTSARPMDAAADAAEGFAPEPIDLRTYLAVAAMAIPALLLLISGIVAGLPPAEGEVEDGVVVGGQEISSGGWESTSGQLESRFDSYLDQPITLVVGDRQVEVTPEELGMEFDTEATHERALEVGRGDVFTAARERFTAHTSGVEIMPVVTFDQETFLAAIRELSAGVLKSPENARFIENNGSIEVEASTNGVGIDTGAALQNIREAVQEFQSGPIEVPAVELQPEIATADLEAVLTDANELAGSSLIVRDGRRGWELPSSELVSLLEYDGGSVSLDYDRLAPRIGTLTNEVWQLASNADIVRNDAGEFEIEPETIDRSLDVDASVDAIREGISEGSREIDLVIVESEPSIVAEDLVPLRRELTAIATRGMTVSWSEGQWTLDPGQYADALIWDIQNEEIGFDREALLFALNPAMEAATRPPTNLRWESGQLITTEESQPGMRVDVDASLNNIIESGLNGESITELVTIEDGAIDSETLGIEINQVLGSASTYYGDSGGNRKTNIEVAARAVDGALIAPHSEFSFNDAIGGTATLEDGYMMGYGIMTDNSGTPTTVPSVAGGICQVSTTVFQSAFWAGMPITNRSWHMYWIPRYGDGPGGLKGLDATVEPDYGLDFNFYNPTDDWLAVEAHADGQWITVELWGVDQGWTVDVEEPKITNVVEASNDIVRQEDDSVEPGNEIWVESAQDGFDAAIHRTVKDRDGNVIDDHTFYSTYVPARNVVLVAPGEGGGSSGNGESS